jgi:hypothetical protein
MLNFVFSTGGIMVLTDYRGMRRRATASKK